MNLNDYFEKNSSLTVPLLGFPGVHLNGTTIKTNIFDSAVQVDTIMAIDRTFNPDILLTFMDLTVEAHALAAPVIYNDMESPSVKEYIVKTEEDLKRLDGVFSVDNQRVQVFTQTVRELKQRQAHKPIAAYVAGPFTLAGLLMGANDIAMNTVLNPDFVSDTVQFATKVIDAYSRALVSAGADMIVILEPTGVMLSPEMYWDFSGRPTQELVQTIERFTVLHICGNTEHLIPGMCKTGVNGLSLDAAVDLQKIAPLVPSDVCIMGNIDPVRVMCNKSPDEVRSDTLSLRKTMEGHRNFVLSTGCDLPPETPPENITAFIKAGKEEIPA